ncbi:MAG: GNAT family N-acetyltransferase [Caldilineaceae bacterium]|nr:GNAT family N-acetyltransferase [Caldilineaceae bacterium]
MTTLELETVAFDAWPAAEVVIRDGWRLRYNHGVTRRANSVWPNHLDSAADVDELMQQVERFYRARHAPVRYQISPAMQPADLDQRLAERGYEAVSHTAVQIAALSRVCASPRTAEGVDVILSDEVDDAWFSAYCRAEQLSGPSAETRRAILERIPPATAFARAIIEGEIIAVGSGVAANGWLGLFNMTTLTAFRRRGVGRALVNSLAAWAIEEGMTCAYLQVMVDNLPALRLYASAGFATRYEYHYRESG